MVFSSFASFAYNFDEKAQKIWMQRWKTAAPVSVRSFFTKTLQEHKFQKHKFRFFRFCLWSVHCKFYSFWFPFLWLNSYSFYRRTFILCSEINSIHCSKAAIRFINFKATSTSVHVSTQKLLNTLKTAYHGKTHKLKCIFRLSIISFPKPFILQIPSAFLCWTRVIEFNNITSSISCKT